jgi:hypothetical protein
MTYGLQIHERPEEGARRLPPKLRLMVFAIPSRSTTVGETSTPVVLQPRGVAT